MEKLPKLIGVCLSTLHDEDRFNFVKELNKQATANDFRILIFNSTSDLYDSNNKDTEGASSVFRLIPYEKLSAIIIFPNFIYNENILKHIISKSHENNIPIISIDKEIEGCICLSFTYADVFETLCRHVIEVHGARKVNLITGFEGNSFSEERKQAYRRALEANGIPYDENNVGYGCFWSGPTNDILLQWFDIEKRELPDAIICANDTMAITVSTFLQQRGYAIPDDCIVTGFDGIEQSRYHLPRLTTCMQDYAEMSRLVIEKILAFMNGEETDGKSEVGFNIIYSQSCGCRSMNDVNVNTAITGLIDRMRLSNERQTMMCSLQSSIAKMSDINELSPILIDKFRFHTTIFAINDDVFNAPDFGSNRKDENSFSDKVNILHQKYFWCDLPPCTIEKSELIPHYELLAKRTEPIVVCTVHFIDMVMGYCIFQPDIDIDEYQKMHIFMSAIGAALGNFHGRMQIRTINERLIAANKELSLLSQRDFMTGLFNRRGFFDKLEGILSDSEGENLTIIVISADLNKLKYINDSFGHHEGDNAINTVGRALVSSSVQGEICARFGGDEFCVAVVIPSQEASYYFNDFKDRFLDYLYDYNRKSDKPYIVKASIGCCIEKLDEHVDINAMIRIADENMYDDKLRYKQSEQK